MENKKESFGNCTCRYCTKWGWPLLWYIPKINTYWFETPKNGTVSVKWGQKVRKHITVPPDDIITPVVVWRDPVERFKSLIKHYFVKNGGRTKFGSNFLKRHGMDLKNMNLSDITDFVLDNIHTLNEKDEVHHFYPQVVFIDEENYSTFELIEISQVSSRFKVGKLNVSNVKVDLEFSEEQVEKIKNLYYLDYMFYEKHKDDIVKLPPNKVKVSRKNNPIGLPEKYNRGYDKNQFEEIFENIYKKSFWKHGDGSGSDSRPEIVSKMFPALTELIEKYDIKTISDLGCGSHYVFKDYTWPDNVMYTGYDASATAIERAKKNCNRNDFNFVVESNWENIEPTDLLIIKDVLCHWPVKLVEEFYKNVTQRFKYVAVIGVEKITMCQTLADFDDEWRFLSGKGTQYGIWLYKKK